MSTDVQSVCAHSGTKKPAIPMHVNTCSVSSVSKNGPRLVTCEVGSAPIPLFPPSPLPSISHSYILCLMKTVNTCPIDRRSYKFIYAKKPSSNAIFQKVT